MEGIGARNHMAGHPLPVRQRQYITEGILPSARVKMAARLYVSGACKTKREASAAAGLHPNYLSMLTSPNRGSEPVKMLIDEMHGMINDKTVDTSVVIERLGRMALGKLAGLMHSDNEHIVLKAAQDLADRAPSTSKTTKLQVDHLTLHGEDAKALAKALVESAQDDSEFDEVLEGDFVEVDIDQPQPVLPKDAA